MIKTGPVFIYVRVRVLVLSVCVCVCMRVLACVNWRVRVFIMLLCKHVEVPWSRKMSFL